MPALNFSYLSTALSPQKVIVFDTIDSTNQYLLDHLHALPHGTLCLAEQQTAGRGRRGRKWQSPFGAQIIMSLYWQCRTEQSLEGLSLIVGLAIIRTLSEAGVQAQIKWPNDILLNGRKLAGILVEIAHQRQGTFHLVIGIGLNIALPRENTDIDQAWANLNEALDNPDRNALIVQLNRHLSAYLREFAQHGISAKIRQEWQHADAFFGKRVNILRDNLMISGIEQGIDEKGYVQIATENGISRFNGGEVSLRGA